MFWSQSRTPVKCSGAEASADVNTSHGSERTDLKRGLSGRHMQMIAIGGAIGTGLFVASGATVSTAGPGGALVAYTAIGLMVLLLMQSLGEMSAHMPVVGNFQTYAARFISPSFGFAMGWNYWFNWAVTVSADLVASGIVMSYWFPDVPGWMWAAGFLVLLTVLNALSARVYGEAEFWLATIKVVTIIVFLVSGVAMIFGVLGNGSPGFANWRIEDAPFHGGFLPIVTIFMIAGFSFQGTELVGVAAAESGNPHRDVPRAIKTVFWRIMFFYIGAIAIIGTLIPFTDPNLLRSSESDIAYSPFTLVFDRLGVAAAAAVMNAVILTSILSAGNSGLYASSRMLHSMALIGQAPRVFCHVTKRGVPLNAMLATAAVSALGFCTALVGEGTAYTWLVSIVGVSGIFMWLGIAACHIRFRRAYLLQGYKLEDLPYRAPFFPFGPILAFVMCLIVLLGQNYEAVFMGHLWEIISAYIGVPLFLGVWLGYHLVKRDRMTPLAELDVRGVSREQIEEDIERTKHYDD